MIRTILHPSGEVRELPPDTPCTWAPRAMDEAVAVGVEVRRYDAAGARMASFAGDCDSATIAYPTTRKARREADAQEEFGPDAIGGLDVIDEWGIGHIMGVALDQESLGSRCLVHLGERDGLGRRIWRLARREIPRDLLDEADRALAALDLPAARKMFDMGLREGGTIGWALRLAIVQAERAGLNASHLIALRARCHAIVGHDHGA